LGVLGARRFPEIIVSSPEEAKFYAANYSY